VSIYAVNKLCRRLVHEPELREAFATSPERAVRSAQPPLDEDEIALLLAGDVGELSRRGANSFLLHQIGRFGLLGLDLQSHGERMRAAWATERAEWGMN
jgi:hypothetical protein